MGRPLTSFSGQRADLPLEELAPLAKDMGYDGPLSVEWGDAGMDRVHGASESASFVGRLAFEPSTVAFLEW